jgi:hypothetical protein
MSDGTKPSGRYVEFPESDDLGSRKTAFSDIFLDLLAKRGYTNPRSLKIRGAYAYLVDKPGGGTTRIGLKTAYDGWLNTAHKMVEACETVWVMSMRWTDGGDSELEVHQIAAKELLGIYDRIHATRKKLSRDSDYTYIPVLNTTRTAYLQQHPNHYACSEGALEDYADSIFLAPVFWCNRVRYAIMSQQKEIEVVADPLQGIDDPIAALKQLIAKRNNTTPDKVEVLVRC